MTSFAEWEYIKFRLGRKSIRAHVDAVHAASPESDKYTGQIANDIAKKANCSAIVATVSRNVADLNRSPNRSNLEAIKEYRQAIRLILEHIGILDDGEKATRPFCISGFMAWLIDRIAILRLGLCMEKHVHQL